MQQISPRQKLFVGVQYLRGIAALLVLFHHDFPSIHERANASFYRFDLGQCGVAMKSLHAKVGELTLENDFLEGALNKAGLLSAKR
jgi:hypothetical protein